MATGMTKTALVRTLAEKLELTNKQSAAFLDLLAETAVKETKKNGVFVIPGLGRLVKAERKARLGRDILKLAKPSRSKPRPWSSSAWPRLLKIPSRRQESSEQADWWRPSQDFLLVGGRLSPSAFLTESRARVGVQLRNAGNPVWFGDPRPGRQPMVARPPSNASPRVMNEACEEGPARCRALWVLQGSLGNRVHQKSGHPIPLSSSRSSSRQG